MGIKERFQRVITMTVLQMQSILIVTLLSTLCLLKVWQRFLNDAMSVEWYVYLILIFIFAIPLYKKKIVR